MRSLDPDERRDHPPFEQPRFAPLPEWTQPLVWTPQGKRPLYRFVAHLLIRVLVLLPMPPQFQACGPFAFPASPF